MREKLCPISARNKLLINVKYPIMTHQENPFFTLFNEQIRRFKEIGNSTASERIAKLDQLSKALKGSYRAEIHTALQADLGKPGAESDLTEIYPVIAEIRHTRKNLKHWMRPKKVGTPLALMGSSSKIRYESKGVCLIVSPWNYPVNLTLVPLVSAIAAGNCCILKPSELSPTTAKVISKLISEIFEPAEVSVVEGDVAVSTALLQLPFHHIFFTGSPRVGKIVMQAAAEHLASCTLELGGKSPAYIGESASLKTAARRIAWGKCTNAGQTCIAPDYLLVMESVKAKFVGAIIQEWKSFYPNGAEASQDLTQIVNASHFNRLKSALDEAVAKGARILFGGNSNPETLFMEPTLLDNLSPDCSLMQEEIFGPILPIVDVSGPEEALSVIRSKERPLSFYIFSRNKREIKHLEEQTRAGGTCVNHNLIHYANLNLPFGGINNSGMGKSHGFAGFLEFSHERPVLRQYLPSMAELVRPPYSDLRQRIAEWTMRWF